MCRRYLARVDPASVDGAVELRPSMRGVLHQAAFFVFLPLLAWLVVVRPDGAGARVACGIYAVCLLAMLGVSALYHRGRWTAPVRRRLKRLDHSTILLAIAGTYTPVVGLGVQGGARTIVLVGVWAGALAGITIRMVWIDAPRPLVAAVYLVLGWSALFIVPTLARSMGATAFGLVAAGGLLYTAGAVAYATKRPNPVPAVFGFHEVFHACVVAAALCHFAAIAIVAG